MLDRRLFLAASACAAALMPHLAVAAPQPGSDPAEAAKLNALFDRMFKEQLKESPQGMTGLGLDKGEGAWAKSKLDDASQAQVKRLIGLQRGWMSDLKRIDRAKLTGMDAVNYDTIYFQGDVTLSGAERFSYGASGYPAPYLLSQLSGAYQSVPDFLDSQHSIETAADAQAYLSRLAQFATVMDQETERAKADGAAGVIPPDFVIDKALIQMKALRSTPAEKTTLVGSVVRRTAEKHIDGDWGGRAKSLVDGPVFSALDRQIALLESWLPHATHHAGVDRLPNGAAYYAFGTKYYTTSGMSPDEIHKLGLDLVASLSADADKMFASQGMTQGTVGARMAALFKDPRFIYPNTDEGKDQLLAYLNGLVKIVSAKLPQYFGALPKAGLDIRRVPKPIEAGAPGGYYNAGTLDGSRPGAYYINLRDTAEVPKWTLPTLTYHEGIPGHHLQGTLALEAQGIPMIRKVVWFSGYGEGWALYSEQLADEIGMYADDPFGRIGYLHDAIFRAVRLVVDSGMHAKGWSREQAIKYYMDAIGDPETVATTEVERYCVWPGQACSYMIGKVTWLRLRAAAKAKLGDRFDIRAFHDAGLLAGAMPLEVLEHRINDWAASVA
ncbi:MAG TPA: DUF885 family protein [Caulobacteraceae bacterium]|jgi:uncharacterized protein (DUF885 family)|nr:DUF885 family protein [Caulobacteraceae bacterium]